MSQFSLWESPARNKRASKIGDKLRDWGISWGETLGEISRNWSLKFCGLIGGIKQMIIPQFVNRFKKQKKNISKFISFLGIWNYKNKGFFLSTF